MVHFVLEGFSMHFVVAIEKCSKNFIFAYSSCQLISLRMCPNSSKRLLVLSLLDYSMPISLAVSRFSSWVIFLKARSTLLPNRCLNFFYYYARYSVLHYFVLFQFLLYLHSLHSNRLALDYCD